MSIYVIWSRTDAPDGPLGAGELAYQLRGGPVFEILASQRQAEIPTVEGRTPVPNAKATARGDVAFANLALLVDYPRLLRDLTDARIPLIIDVHFPIGSTSINAIQPGATDDDRDESLDRAALDLWSQPERVQLSRDILEMAMVVTSPREDWAAFLRRSFLPVAVLPDVNSPKTGGQFAKEMMRCVRRARGVRQTAGGAVGGILLAWQVRKQLEASGIDWQARMGGRA